MIKQREYALAKGSVVLQVFLSIICFLLALWVTQYYFQSVRIELIEYRVVLILIMPLWYILLDHFRLGNMRRTEMYSMLFVEYLTVVFLGLGILLSVIVILDYDVISRMALGTFALLNLAVLYLYKLSVYRIMKYLRRNGYNIRWVLIIADEDSHYFIDRLIKTTDWGYRIAAIITDSKLIQTLYGKNYKILPQNVALDEIIDKKSIDEVMYCSSNMDHEHIRNLIYTCAEVGIIFRMQSDLLSIASMRSRLTYFHQMPFITFMNTPSSYVALKVKSVLDYIVALLILLLISPVMLIIAIAILLDDGGPVFFRQTRVGMNGRKFKCIKFRTMVNNAEELKAKLKDENEQKGPVFKIKDDPRVTQIGKFLRKSSLDELPQFINVLRGEMSIVGPRPPVPSEVMQYERWQRRRLSMKPGLTCIWQVSGRNNIPFEQWMKMDLQYIDTWSLKLDLILFLKTFKVLARWDGQ